MTTQYWLVKQEPETYAWNTFVKDGRTTWDGVRNYQARNHLKGMKKGDQVLFYASVTTKAILGTATVGKTAFRDPSAPAGEDWVAVELIAGDAFAKPVSLADIKAEPTLAQLALLRQSRLSVMPLTASEFKTLTRMGKG